LSKERLSKIQKTFLFCCSESLEDRNSVREKDWQEQSNKRQYYNGNGHGISPDNITIAGEDRKLPADVLDTREIKHGVGKKLNLFSSAGCIEGTPSVSITRAIHNLWKKRIIKPVRFVSDDFYIPKDDDSNYFPEIFKPYLTTPDVIVRQFRLFALTDKGEALMLSIYT